MIKLNTNKVRVRCLECKEEHFIDIELKNTDKEQRSFGYEYEYTYRGEKKCSKCNEQMILEFIIFEYPKGIVNYIEIGNEGCLEMDDVKHVDNEVIFNNNDKI